MTVSVDDAETGGTLTDGVWQPRWDTRGTRSFIDTLVLLLKVGSGGGGGRMDLVHGSLETREKKGGKYTSLCRGYEKPKKITTV